MVEGCKYSESWPEDCITRGHCWISYKDVFVCSYSTLESLNFLLGKNLAYIYKSLAREDKLLTISYGRLATVSICIIP